MTPRRLMLIPVIAIGLVIPAEANGKSPPPKKPKTDQKSSLKEDANRALDNQGLIPKPTVDLTKAILAGSEERGARRT